MEKDETPSAMRITEQADTIQTWLCPKDSCSPAPSLVLLAD